MTDAPDFRSDPSESPEGRGIAYGRLDRLLDSMPDNVQAEASRGATIRLNRGLSGLLFASR